MVSVLSIPSHAENSKQLLNNHSQKTSTTFEGLSQRGKGECLCGRRKKTCWQEKEKREKSDKLPIFFGIIFE